MIIIPSTSDEDVCMMKITDKMYRGKIIGAKLMGMTPQIDQTGFVYI